jgi:UDP-N-acetylmuramate dehydrogenase
MRHILAENFYAAAQRYNRAAMNTASPLVPTIASHWPLQALNTFGIAATARAYLRVSSSADLQAVRANTALSTLPRLVLGGGSNLVLSGDFDGLVLHLANQGKSIVSEDDTHIIVSAQAGENWHEFVQWTLVQNLPGLENLSLIPGSVGAAPIQNIGAYGSELKDFFHSLTYFDFSTGEISVIDREACRFAYRDSIFKQELRDRVVILDVSFALPKQWQPNLSYTELAHELTASGVVTPIARDISEAVIAIRRRKLPDPSVIGNAGSFFKNPVVSNANHTTLLEKYPQLVSYVQPDGSFKLSAGWMIDQCGWKGKSLGAAGVHEKQALVLINRGGASGADVLKLAQAIQDDVQQHFGVKLEIEPVLV